jgi:hypothetical protein
MTSNKLPSTIVNNNSIGNDFVIIIATVYCVIGLTEHLNTLCICI